jgi:hypothetical protein
MALLTYVMVVLGRAITADCIDADGDDLNVPEHRPKPPKDHELLVISLPLAMHRPPLAVWLPVTLPLRVDG